MQSKCEQEQFAGIVVVAVAAKDMRAEAQELQSAAAAAAVAAAAEEEARFDQLPENSLEKTTAACDSTSVVELAAKTLAQTRQIGAEQWYLSFVQQQSCQTLQEIEDQHCLDVSC